MNGHSRHNLRRRGDYPRLPVPLLCSSVGSLYIPSTVFGVAADSKERERDTTVSRALQMFDDHGENHEDPHDASDPEMLTCRRRPLP